MSFLSINGQPVYVPTSDDAFDAIANELQHMSGWEPDDLCWTADPEFLASNRGWRVRAYLWMPDPHHPNRDPYGERTFVLTHGEDGGWKAACADNGYIPWCRDVRDWGLEDTLMMDGHYLRPLDPEGFDCAKAAVRASHAEDAPDPYDEYESERWPHRLRLSRR